MGIRVSPSAENVPGVSGKSSKFLTTDGKSLSWGSPSGWNLVTSSTIPGSTGTLTISGVSGKRIYVVVEGMSGTAAADVNIRLNGDSGSNYYRFASAGTATSAGFITGTASASVYSASFMIDLADTTLPYKPISMIGSQAGGGGIYKTTSVISSVSIILTSGQFDAGSYYVYNQVD